MVLWEGVTQELMSDEEDMVDGKVKVKTPTWRSAELSALIVELDKRVQAQRRTKLQPLRRERISTESPNGRQPSKRVRRKHLRCTADDEDEDEPPSRRCLDLDHDE